MSKRKCVFNHDLQTKYKTFIAKPELAKHEAFCTICNTKISIANKGRYDLEQHIGSQRHKQSLQAGEGSSSLTQFFIPKSTKLDDKVAAAEGTLAFHTLKHHFSFRSTDCSSSLFKEIFDDSQIAKLVKSAHTKTRAIAKNVITPFCIENIKKEISEIPYISVSTDGSIHGSIKMFPFLIQYFNAKTGIQTKMLHLNNLQDEKSETIANYIIKYLTKFNLLEKCIAFSADNCNTNFGGIKRAGENNVYYKLKSKLEKDLIGIGCPVHITSNSAKTGFDSFPVDVELICIKIFNFFSIYTVRTESLKEFCSFAEIEYKNLLGHSGTRWLSLFPAVNRILEVFPALKSYFLSIDNCPVILERFFNSNLSEAFLYFVHSLQYVFHERSKEMEMETNSILEVSSIVKSLKTTLKCRIDQNFLPISTNTILLELIRNGFETEVNSFKNDCMKCYRKSLEYLEKWTIHLDEFSCFNWMKLDEVPEWTSVELTLKYVSSKGVELSFNDSKGFDQFCNLKNFVAAKLSDTDDEFKKLISSAKWLKFFENNNNSEYYSELLKICQFFFCIPGQNANVERIFSLIGAQWTKERNKFKMSTIRSILTVVYNLKDLKCKSFKDLIINDKKYLALISSSKKYNSDSSESESDIDLN